MSTTKLEWQVDINQFPQDIDSVVLEDPTAAYGVIRKDTSDVIVSAGVPMTNPATGYYTYSFVDPAPGLEYRYYIKTTVGSEIYYYERDYSKSDASVSVYGRYASSGCMYNKFGQDNILAWARFSDSEDEATITSHINAAICYADNFVDDVLRGSPYIVPFYPDVPSTIRDIACALAGIQLYEARGIEDFDDASVTRLSGLKREKLLELSFIKSGRTQLPEMIGSFHLDVVCSDTGRDSTKTIAAS